MVAAAAIIQRSRPDIRFVAAASSEVQAARMRRMTLGVPMEIHCGKTHELMQTAAAGIVCSGTATLEAAFFGLPYCVVYKIAWLTFEVGRRLVNVDALGIINILNNYRVNPPADPRLPALAAPHIVREFIQHHATPDALAREALRLLADTRARAELTGKMQAIIADLDGGGASRRAARAILDALP